MNPKPKTTGKASARRRTAGSLKRRVSVRLKPMLIAYSKTVMACRHLSGEELRRVLNATAITCGEHANDEALRRGQETPNAK